MNTTNPEAIISNTTPKPIIGLKYPITKKVDQVDDYHGIKVADPYRWLEDDNSAETKAWVIAQNEVTFGYLSQIPNREKFRKRIEEVIDYERYSSPQKKGNWFYFYKNDGLQNQSVLYRQEGFGGKTEIVIDPNTLSDDGTTQLVSFVLSKDGKYAAWGISKGGSDWQTFFVRNMETGVDLEDSLHWVKASNIAWQGNGFYYSRYPSLEKGGELSGINENHQVYYHEVGTSQAEDTLIYEDPANPQRFHFASTSEDERFTFFYIHDRGKGLEGNALWFLDNKSTTKQLTPIIKDTGNYRYTVIDSFNEKFLVETNDNAENGKVVLFDPVFPAKMEWKVIIPEAAEPLESIRSVGGKLFASYLKDVATHTYIFDREGNKTGEVNFPALGNVIGFNGEKDDAFTFYTFSSYNCPPIIYKYNINTGESILFRKAGLAFEPEDYEVNQEFYHSKDGTKIPLFIIHKKGIKKDGKNPTILYGYGGFNVNITPGFNPALIPWLEQGGIYAVANLRGGGEYGEKWHEEGMKLKKQNVFDDFIAAAEFLISHRYCSSDYLAIRGGSNGGLLVGAVMNQRPDLVKVAIPQVGVMDMLRFQKFTIGWNWIADYGSSENSQEFKVLYAYSPIHNIKPGVSYPATLVITADHDDRVVPAHSFKYAATLQALSAGKAPVLIRIDTKSGHGASNTAKTIETTADIYSFILYNMGITPRF